MRLPLHQWTSLVRHSLDALQKNCFTLRESVNVALVPWVTGSTLWLGRRPCLSVAGSTGAVGVVVPRKKIMKKKIE